jgi:pantetheine-phosphate adenylyltransferase
MIRIAIYPGSFDPPTRGHEDLIRRSLTLVDRLIVGVAENLAKQPLFRVDERLALLREIVSDEPRITVTSFPGLLADFARAHDARLVVRGVRAVGDFEFELQMAMMNRQLNPDLETIFLPPAFDLTYVSASLVREVARLGGALGALVRPSVADALRKKLGS